MAAMFMGRAPAGRSVSIGSFATDGKESRLTTPATVGTNTLSVHREATRRALDEARAAAIGANGSLAGSDAAIVSSRGGSGRRSSSRRSSGGSRRSRRGSSSRGSASAGDGSGRASAVLSNGHLLELSLGLLSGRVDGEDHALAAVAGLSAVEPWISMLAGCSRWRHDGINASTYREESWP